MKKIVAVLALALCASAVSAQVVVYDYLRIMEIPGMIIVVSSNAETRLVPVEKEKPIHGYDIHEKEWKAMFALVQEYESIGWELVEVTSNEWWVMRKPKQ